MGSLGIHDMTGHGPSTPNPGAGLPVRFAVLCSGSLAAWQDACVQDLVGGGEATLVGIVDVERDLIGPDARIPPDANWSVASASVAAEPLANDQYADLDFLLSFAPRGYTFGAGSFRILRFRFAGIDVAESDVKTLRAALQRHETVEVEVISEGPGQTPTVVVHRAEVRTSLTGRGTENRLYRIAPQLCAGAARRLRAEMPAPTVPNLVRIQSAQNRPGDKAVTVYRRIARAIMARWFFREVWTIGIINAPIISLLAGEKLPPPQWIIVPTAGRFCADPFPLVIHGDLHVLFETWSMFNGRGWISAVVVDGSLTPVAHHTLAMMDKGFHASYPFVFEHEGAVYCCPEMWEAGGLQLFRMGRTIDDWMFCGSSLDGVAVVDPTLFVHEGRWWLFATIRDKAPLVNLYAWYADSPFGPWTPHRLNPVKSDIRSARPAGAVFRVDGELFRPAQDCSTGYGVALVVNQILRLDPDGFEENKVAWLRPEKDWSWPDGTHTVNAYDKLMLIDAKRLVFDPLAAFWTLLPYCRRWWHRRRGGN